jgi:hypothetical protein
MTRLYQCICRPPVALADAERRPCRYGRCTEWRCPRCGANLGGFGAMGCKCDGYVRELFFPDMCQREACVAVKPSILRRRNAKPRRRERMTRL